ncbi:MAG: alpha/beta hydrolase [Actinobacteria bacterium]|nr:alpha/beta hydrolase [Actinomycetota bacterium]
MPFLVALATFAADALWHAATGLQVPGPPRYPLPVEAVATDGRFVEIDGRRYHVVEWGAGPPLVFLHGFLSDAYVWRPVAGRLFDQFRCIAVDLPGFGLSAKGPDIPRGARARAQWLARTLDALDVGRAVLVGASLGGQTALALAAHDVARVARLVLIASMLDSPPPQVRVPRRLFPAVVRAFQPTLFSRRWIDRRQRQQAFRPAAIPGGRLDELYRQTQTDGFLEGILEGYVFAPSEDLWGDVPRVAAPTLIVWGDHDATVPIAQGLRLAREHVDARLVVIPCARHSVQLDRPDLLAEKIRAFVLEPSGATEG